MLGRYTTGPRPVADDSRRPPKPPTAPRRSSRVDDAGNARGSYTPAATSGGEGSSPGEEETRDHDPRDGPAMTLSRDPRARIRARGRWAALSERLQTVSPESLTKGVIAAIVIGAGLWLSVASWPALAPFLA